MRRYPTLKVTHFEGRDNLWKQLFLLFPHSAVLLPRPLLKNGKWRFSSSCVGCPSHVFNYYAGPQTGPSTQKLQVQFLIFSLRWAPQKNCPFSPLFYLLAGWSMTGYNHWSVTASWLWAVTLNDCDRKKKCGFIIIHFKIKIKFYWNFIYNQL